MKAEACIPGIVRKAQTGDETAFDLLCNKYRGKLMVTGKRIMRNNEDAEDAIQEALLRAWGKLKTFRGESKFSTWLTRIMINSCLMDRRRKKCRGVYDEVPIVNSLQGLDQDYLQNLTTATERYRHFVQHNSALVYRDPRFEAIDSQTESTPLCSAFRATLRELFNSDEDKLQVHARYFVAAYLCEIPQNKITALFREPLGTVKMRTQNTMRWLEENCREFKELVANMVSGTPRAEIIQLLFEMAFGDFTQLIHPIHADPWLRIENTRKNIQGILGQET